MKQMYLPLKFTMVFKAAPHSPGLKINITLMTPCNCLLSSSDKLAEWTEALNSISLSLQWQLLCRDWKTCFFSLFLKKTLLSSCFYPCLFCLNLGDSIFSSLWAKLMAVQELIVQACVWLPDGEWMWIRVGSGFTMTCFFLGTGNGEEAMGECWTWGWIGVPPRHLNLSLYSSQQKRKIILHIRDDSISNESCCFIETF